MALDKSHSDLNLNADLVAKYRLTVKEQFVKNHVLELLTKVFKEGANQSLESIANKMVFWLTPLHLDLGKLTLPVEIWYGTEDRHLSQPGVEIIAK